MLATKLIFGMRTPRLDQARSRLCVVDEMRTLQVESARAQVADFDSGLRAKLLFE